MEKGSVHVLPLQPLPCVHPANPRGERCAWESLSHSRFSAGREKRRCGEVGARILRPQESRSRRCAYLAVLVLDIIRQFPKHFHGSA